MYSQTIYHSPVGDLLLKASAKALVMIHFDGVLTGEEHRNPILASTLIWLDEYFSGKRNVFTIPPSAAGTEFQQRVWKQLVSIAYGDKVSYLQLSKQLGNVLAIRAVTNANGKNPIPIIIPCHRVVGSKGELVGFSGGLWRKQLLLELEGNTLFWYPMK